MAKVFIATPVYDWKNSVHYTSSALAMQRYMIERGEEDPRPRIVNGAEPDRSRNQLIAEFMFDPSFTHICFIDSDQGWPADAVSRLVSHSVDMVGVPIQKKTNLLSRQAVVDLLSRYEQDGVVSFADIERLLPEPEWNLSGDGASWDNEKRLLEIQGETRGIGAGMIMCSRECIERMMDGYPELKINNTLEPNPAFHEYLYALFQRARDKQGLYRSEDLTFCERWAALGGAVYADPIVSVCHAGHAEWTGRYCDSPEFLRAFQEGRQQDEADTVHAALQAV